MSRRKRALMLTLLALAVPLPAYAITNEVLAPSAGPSSISVSASLDSCGVIDNGVACKIDVSFSEVANAASYTATVTRADGSVIDYGAIGAGGTSIWVPYVGAGTYSVKVTAYGEPETTADPDGRGDVIATGYSSGQPTPGPDTHGANSIDPQSAATEAGSRNPGAEVNTDADGAATTDAQSSAPAPAETTTTTETTTSTPETTTTCTTPAETAPAPTPPVEPPADTDPDNPDEDVDGIPDEQERATYEQQLAEYQAALAAQQQTTTVGC